MITPFEIDSLLLKFPDYGELRNLLNPVLQKNESVLEQSSSDVMKLALEYARLASLPQLSEKDANRLEEILAIANHIDILNFWITEVDHILGHHLDLLDEDNRESYQDQQALLKDYVGVMESFPIPDDKQIKDYKPPLKPWLYDYSDELIPH
jgi:hypothetical protein